MKKVYFENYHGSIKCNAEEVVLCSEDNRYGIINLDTEEVVVAPLTAVRKEEEVGLYSFDVSSLEDDYAYEIVFRAKNNDVYFYNVIQFQILYPSYTKSDIKDKVRMLLGEPETEDFSPPDGIFFKNNEIYAWIQGAIKRTFQNVRFFQNKFLNYLYAIEPQLDYKLADIIEHCIHVPDLKYPYEWIYLEEPFLQAVVNATLSQAFLKVADMNKFNLYETLFNAKVTECRKYIESLYPVSKLRFLTEDEYRKLGVEE